MKLFIKNMVCERCIMVINDILQELNLNPYSIILGEVDFGNIKLQNKEVAAIKSSIEAIGFELVSNNKQALIEQVKISLIQLINNENDLEKIKLSAYLRKKTNHDYQSLSQLFSSVECLTIEKYFIKLKIERIKELLIYDELSLTEIFNRLGYSSLAHLSSQFKQVTGMSPSSFKKLKDNKQRHSLDSIQ